MGPLVVIGLLALVGVAIIVASVIYHFSTQRSGSGQAEWDIAVSQSARSKLSRLLKELEGNPTDLSTHTAVYGFVRTFPHLANDAYQAALVLLENEAEPSLRVFTLELGRLAYGVQRPEGVPTVYDENAINNDILARTGK